MPTISFSSPQTARSPIVRMIQQRRIIINVEESSNVMIFDFLEDDGYFRDQPFVSRQPFY